MDGLASYIVTLVSALILMTAVEIIAPDNSMKKYVKFVLGLLLIVVMISPIIKFLTSGEQGVLNEIRNLENEYSMNIEEFENNQSMKLKEKKFSENLNENCKKELEEEFDDLEFIPDIKCDFNYENMKCSIVKVNVKVKDKGVSKIEDIEIDLNGESDKEDSNANDEFKEVVNYISDLLKISKDKIYISK